MDERCEAFGEQFYVRRDIMFYDLENRLVVGVSSRALFDLSCEMAWRPTAVIR